MLNFTAYQAHEALSRPARDTAQIWRLILGLILIAGVFLLSYQFLESLLFTLLGESRFGALIGANGEVTQSSVLFVLYCFGLIMLGVAVALRVAHNRGIAGLLGERRLFMRQFFSVLAIMVLLFGALAILPPWDMGAPLVPNVPMAAWLTVLPLALGAVLVQVSAEEILFRGYLQQQLAARFGSPLIWLVVPSVLFASGHYAPEAGDLGLLLVVWAGLFGILAADLTARAGTLGPAIALHFMNNTVAILFVSMPDGLSGLALYHSPFDLTDTEMMRAWIPVEFMTILVCWLAARLAIRR